MMLLKEETVQLIIRGLSSPISIDVLTPEDVRDLEEEHYDLALEVFSSDKGRGRTLESCKVHSFWGLAAEYMIARSLSNAGLHVFHNREAHTLQYHWDLSVGGYLIEVKQQGTQVDGLSFNSDKKAETAIQKWRDWHLMIAWKHADDETIIPWAIVDHEAFNPVHGLYQKSYWNGSYLQTNNAAARGMFKYIHVS